MQILNLKQARQTYLNGKANFFSELREKFRHSTQGTNSLTKRNVKTLHQNNPFQNNGNIRGAYKRAPNRNCKKGIERQNKEMEQKTMEMGLFQPQIIKDPQNFFNSSLSVIVVHLPSPILHLVSRKHPIFTPTTKLIKQQEAVIPFGHLFKRHLIHNCI